MRRPPGSSDHLAREAARTPCLPGVAPLPHSDVDVVALTPGEPPYELTAALQPGERRVWIGKPGVRPLRRSDAFTIPFALMFVLLVAPLITTSVALSMITRSGMQPLPGSLDPLTWSLRALGLALLIIPFIVRPIQAGRTTYALTDSRAFVVIGRRVISEPRGNGPFLVRTNHAATRMQVMFGPAADDGATRIVGALSPTGGHVPRLVFDRVADVAGLQAALRLGATG